MNPNLSEICWIVNKRNIWASRRGKIRSKIYYYETLKGWSPWSSRIRLLKEQFRAVNSEKEALNVYTKRLRQLLKLENARLISDKNAGYHLIVVALKDRHFLMINKHDITLMAETHEADIAIQALISGDITA